MILYSVHPNTKLCLFSVKIWFVKTSIRIVKYESQVVNLHLYYGFFLLGGCVDEVVDNWTYYQWYKCVYFLQYHTLTVIYFMNGERAC